MAMERNSPDNDILDLWADEVLLSDKEYEQDKIDILSQLKLKNYGSIQKTIFYKICGLTIAKLKDLINENEFQIMVKELLSSYTDNEHLIYNFTNEMDYIIREIKNLPVKYNYIENEGLRNIPIEFEDARNKIIYVDSIENDKFFNLLKLSDFGLINRIEIALYAVMLEMGFNRFNQSIRFEIENIRQDAHACLLPAYRKGIDNIISGIIYMTNFTYGILYNKFYNRTLKQFVDKI